MHAVRAGQVWSLLNKTHVRYSVRVQEVFTEDHERRVRCLVLNTAKSREIVLRARVLSRGSRGAKLLSEPDGEAPGRERRPPPPEPREPTASDFRRVVSPRGHQVPTAKMLAVHAMRSADVPVVDVAKAHSISANCVSAWCSRVEEAIADARQLAKGA